MSILEEPNRTVFLTYGSIAIGLALLAVIVFVALIIRRRPKKLNVEKYVSRWHTVQGMLKDKKMWPLAIIDADKMLDDVLKVRKYKGKTMGERLVAAQHDLTNNDLVWFAHKLRNKLVHEQDTKISKNDVKDALLGIYSALKDLGAIKK